MSFYKFTDLILWWWIMVKWIVVMKIKPRIYLDDWGKPRRNPVRLVGTGIWTRDLQNASLVRYHGATGFGLYYLCVWYLYFVFEIISYLLSVSLYVSELYCITLGNSYKLNLRHVKNTSTKSVKLLHAVQLKHAVFTIVVHRCGAGGSMRTCHAVGPGSIRSGHVSWVRFFGVTPHL